MFTSIPIKMKIMVIALNFFAVTEVFGLSANLTVGELGTLIGSEETTSWSGRRLYAFRGIPYAEAPVGDLRFRPPVKVTTWNGTLDARKYGPVCPQNPTQSSPLSSVDEDCLSLNVYVPEIGDENTSLPVIIWIHGGTFMGGYASIYEPHYLLEENVALVVLQFRLGPLGLLCLQTDEVPGNVQFLDQIMGMRWVQDNIRYFGGDPNRVTLAGQSSGAASVNLHQVSPLSKGLFHQAIIQSGSFYAPWVMDYNPLRTATNLGAIVGCRQTNTTELAACFKSLDVQTLLDGFNRYLSLYTIDGLTSIGGHRAVVQTAGAQRFLEEDPRSLVARGEFVRVPMIGGVTKHDGSYVVIDYYNNFFLPLGFVNDKNFLQYNFTSFVVSTFGMDDASGGIAQTLIRSHYNKADVGDFEKMFPGLVDICSVFAFKAGVFQMMQTNSRHQPSFLYTFGYFGSALASQNASSTLEFGVRHSGELAYLFPISVQMSDKDLAVAKKMTALWTSFAINGKPAVAEKTWEPMTEAFGPYIIIEDESYDGSNYFDEYTIALKEGMTAVDRTSSVGTIAPHFVTVAAAVLWSASQRMS